MSDQINVILAQMAGRTECTTKTVYQYSQGMQMKIIDNGLPNYYRVEYANSVAGTSLGQMCTDGIVSVPSQFFVPGTTIHAWVVLIGETFVVPKKHIMIPISPKALYVEGEPEPEQTTIIDEAIAALNEAVTDAEAAASHYPRINAGYWEVWNPVAGEYESTGVEAQGPQGETGPAGSDGQDGVSPTVTVTDIEGGHRVTITDAEGTQTFDVMDGSSADGSVFIAEYGVTTYSDLLAAFNAGKILVCKYTGSSKTIYSTLYSYQSNDGFRFSVRGQDSTLQTHYFLRTSSGWSHGSYPYNAITDLAAVESGDFLAFVNANSLNRLSRSDNLKFGSDADKYLANDGTWQDVPDSPVQDVRMRNSSILNNGIANIPAAGQQTFGVVGLYSPFGISTSASGYLTLTEAKANDIKAGNDVRSGFSPNHQHQSTFYGLAKAAGDTTQSSSSNTVGNYTESAKSAISQMLNAPVTVSGTTPAITALSGIQYVCGEVATLDITLPESGIVDVTFESGSTPTVLTIAPPTGMTVEWANGFDSTALEADTLYELNIKMVGTKCLGVAGSWT